MHQIQWIQKKQPNTHDVQRFSQELKLPQELITLLLQRGVNTYQKADHFFNPHFEQLHSPWLMKGMDQAVQRILQAQDHKEKVLVYGDYDVDGTTSVALMFGFIEKNLPAINADYYIPDRYKEGYGISKAGIDFSIANGYSLIIALDCGTRSVELIQYAKENGVDFIVCDHHLVGDSLPNCVALLNPKQPECSYPYKELSGCGIGFKFSQAIAQKMGLHPSVPLEYIDLVAVSIASDMVDILGENRVLASLGLQKINQNPCIGLQALMHASQPLKKEPYSATDIVFNLAPRINASGRMDDAKNSVRLLIEKDFHTAIQMANHINEFNNNRKDKDKSITEEAFAIIDAMEGFDQQNAIVLSGKTWHKGVIGIVASRLVDKYHKPSIVFSEQNDMLTGSARSVKGFNIYNAIEQCSNLIHQFGGHKYAAGLSIKKQHFEDFVSVFQNAVTQSLPDNLKSPQIEFDTQLEPSSLDPKFLRIMNKFEPFGPGNPKPVFKSAELKDTGASRLLKNSHLKITAEWNRMPIQGIAFNMAQKTEIVKNQPFQCCFVPEWNKFNGKASIQYRILDIKPCN